MDPGIFFRISRHALLILGITALSVDQMYIGFYEYSELLGNKLYFIAFIIMLTYLCEGYFNMYILIPRYFIRKQYKTYFTLFFLIVLLFVLLHYLIEYLVFRFYEIEPGIYSYFTSYGSPFWLEFFASYFVDSIAILGAGMFVILKYWLHNDEQKRELEKRHVQSQVEKLKEQVTPAFLFTILRKMGDVTLYDQQRASDMLLETCELLRYQLYDSNRESVLIISEINYLNNYLRIEKLYYNTMDYKIIPQGEIDRVLVPPLLFIPIVYNAVKDFQKMGSYFLLVIEFRLTSDFISFSCSCSNTGLLYSDDLYKLKLRLESLYKDRYLLENLFNKEQNQNYLYMQIDLK